MSYTRSDRGYYSTLSEKVKRKNDFFRKIRRAVRHK